MTVRMDEHERELWEMCDVKFNNRLQAICTYAHLKKFDEARISYCDFMGRYGKIDEKKLDGRFPVEAIRQTRIELEKMGSSLANDDYEGLKKHIERLAGLGRCFRSKRYDEYRSTVSETKRRG